MEDPVFIKCEPSLESWMEDNANLESDPGEVKEEVVAMVLPKVEEDSELVVQESMMDEESDIAGTLSELQNNSLSRTMLRENIKTQEPIDRYDHEVLPRTTSEEAFESQNQLSYQTMDHKLQGPIDLSDPFKNHNNEIEPHTSEAFNLWPQAEASQVRSFSKKPNINKNLQNQTNEKLFVCPFCDLSFSQVTFLNQHVRLHTGEKPYVCQYCSQTFRLWGSLNKHVRIHTGVRPYTCEICNRSFTQKNDLNNHGRVHSGEKPHKCEVCNRYFSQKSNLTKHFRIHTGEKPYSCDRCSNSYYTTSDLRKHYRVHSGERPYTCKVCGRAFTQTNSMLKHQNLCSQRTKARTCQICNQSFSSKATLAKHLKTHSGRNPVILV